jgi:lambda family phage portal protein
MSFPALCRFLVSQIPADGEFFIQKVIDTKSPYGLRLRIIDPDQLDMGYNIQRLTNGNMVLMGVEVDQDFTPQAYWFWDKNPYDLMQLNRQRKRVPASEVIHYFSPWFTNQVRGVPEIVSAMWRMNMLDGYEEAEMTAARVGASKMGFLTPKDGDPGEYKGEVDPTDKESIITEATPGAFEILPKGWDMKAFDPQHPNAVFEQFVKACLRGIAAGWGVSYNGLANDLEGVNFSSIRAGLLEERDEWKIQQSDFIEMVLRAIFEWWLEAATLSGAVKLGQYEVSDVAATMVWSPRTWPWVDPYKDAQATVLAQQNGFETMTATLADKGLDFEETIDQIAYEQQYVKAKGVKIGTDAKGVADTASDDQASADDTATTGKKN